MSSELSMEMIFIVTWGGVIIGTASLTLLGCWIYEKVKNRDDKDRNHIR